MIVNIYKSFILILSKKVSSKMNRFIYDKNKAIDSEGGFKPLNYLS